MNGLRPMGRHLETRPLALHATLAAVATRLVVFAIGFGAVLMVGFPSDMPPPPTLWAQVLLDLPGRWDTGWYVGLASHGYLSDGHSGRFENIAFFPAHPLVLRAVAHVLGATTATAWNWIGVGVSTIEFGLALYVLSLLAAVTNLGGEGRTDGMAVRLFSFRALLRSPLQ